VPVASNPSVPQLPRDRCIGDLTTAELIEVVLGRSTTSSGEALAVAALIDTNAGAISRARPEELAADAGVSYETAHAIVAAFEVSRRAVAAPVPQALQGPRDVAAIAQRELAGLRRERLVVIVCDAANRPIRTVAVADGAIDRCPVPVREILNAVLRFDGRAFALAHNHPGRTAEASAADLDVTGRVADAARVVGLRFLGHVVVGATTWSTVKTRAQETPG
jgi:DNA repair protein RadC